MTDTPTVTAAEREMARTVRKRIEKGIGSPGWAFFNAEAVENPIATALAAVRVDAAPVLERLVILANEQTKRAEATLRDVRAQQKADFDRANALQARVAALEAALQRLLDRYHGLSNDPAHRYHAAPDTCHDGTCREFTEALTPGAGGTAT